MASFWFSFKPTDVLPPLLVVVVSIDPSESETLCMTFTLVLADLVLLKRIDIRIVIEYHRTDVVLHQPLDNRRGTRGTTGMQQNLSAPIWNNNRRFLHLLIYKKLAFADFSTAKLIIFLYMSVNLPKKHVYSMIISYLCQMNATKNFT